MNDRGGSLSSSGAIAALTGLIGGFVEGEGWIGAVEEIAAEQVPLPARSLLAHQRHMTATLKAFHGCNLQLEVLAERRDGEFYRRMIALTTERDGGVAEFGVVRLRLSFVDPDVRHAVLDRSSPIGDVFETHRVLTRVEPRWFLRFPTGGPVLEYLRLPPGREAFGRLGVIYCNGQAAIELLEVVPG